MQSITPNMKRTQESRLFLYNHNISGGKEQISKINNKLSQTSYKIILLQETWFNELIHTNAITNITEFNAFRNESS